MGSGVDEGVEKGVVRTKSGFLPLQWNSGQSKRELAVELAWSVVLGRLQKSDCVEHTTIPRSDSQDGSVGPTQLSTVTLDHSYTVQEAERTIARRLLDPKESVNSRYPTLVIRSEGGEDNAFEHLHHNSTSSAMAHACFTATDQGLHYRLWMMDEDEEAVRTLEHRLVSTIRHLLILSPTDKLEKLDAADSQDLQQIWKWNSTVFPASNATVLELFRDSVQRYPTSVAIDAWDGHLSYKELDMFSSAIAQHIGRLGSLITSIVPLLFEKSMWMSVAVLAVIKAGGACVLLDPSQPDQRLSAVISQIQPPLILSSKRNEYRASSLRGCPIQVVDSIEVDSCRRASADKQSTLPELHPDDLICVMFTSGSTGIPKGALMSHQNFSSATRQYAAIYQIDSRSRIFDFVSYAFDVAWANLFLALCTGACLCVPSENERKNDIEGALVRTRATFAFFTPSLARTIRHNLPYSLETVVVGGEKIVRGDNVLFGGKPQLMGVYGPAETTIFATFFNLLREPAYPGYLGTPRLCNTWLTVPGSPDTLAAIGAVGEIWIEGPIVGEGYLKDEDKTAAAFVRDPPWLLAGSLGNNGRTGRLYRSGDMARYRRDGSLEFAGRRDDQVKLRGQRLELGEIEFHTKAYLTSQASTIELVVAAEVTQPKGQASELIVAFVAPSHDTEEVDAFHALMRQAIAGIDSALAQTLPSYMIPSAYMMLSDMPRNISDKIDRRHLRELGSSLTLEQLDCRSLQESGSQSRQPQSKAEKQLQSLWAKVLRKPVGSISADDVFSRIGGDSILAMRLAASARKAGIKLTVRDILQRPRLSDQALLVEQPRGGRGTVSLQPETIPAFALLKPGFDDKRLLQDVASQLQGKILPEQIKDVFPCTPLQEGLLTLTSKQPGDYVATKRFNLATTVDLKRLEDAWVRVVSAIETLRTRIVSISSHGLVQIVLDLPEESVRNDVYAKCNVKEIGLGTALCHAEINPPLIDGSKPASFTLMIHHSLYDGWSLPMLIHAIEEAYEGRLKISSLPFQAFIKYTRENFNQRESDAFWETQLQGSEVLPFPVLPSPDYSPRANSVIQRHIQGNAWVGHSEYTAATFLRSSWAILQAHYSGSGEAIFGTVSTGRQIDLPGVEGIMGPTIATLPMRIRVDSGESIHQILERVQRQALDMVPFEQVGLQNIRKIGHQAELCCRFQTLLDIQVVDGEEHSLQLLGNPVIDSDTPDAFDAFNTFGLLVSFRIKNDGVHVKMSFDSHVIQPLQAKRIVAGLEHVLYTISTNTHQSINKIELLSDKDVQEIRAWNAAPLDTSLSCVHDLLASTARRAPDSLAVNAHDGQLTYGELDGLSNKLAYHLTKLGVSTGSVVLLFFEKSLWMSVAAYAAMKAGAASIALDVTQPEARLSAVCSRAGPKMVLTSVEMHSLAQRLCKCTSQIVNHDELHQIEDSNYGDALPKVRSSDPVVVTYTSGSTGIPKGAVLTHGNFCSALAHQASVYGTTSTSIIFDFASYSFDMGWSNLLTTMFVGGCLYVPSERERKDDLEAALIRSHATFAMLTPSLARAVSKRMLSKGLRHNLKTVVIGGETVRPGDHTIFGSGTDIISVYGPSECTVFVSWLKLTAGRYTTGSLGSKLLANMWLIRPDRSDALAAVGAVGELYIESPLVGLGYLNDETSTKAAFIVDPPWLHNAGNSLQQHGRHCTVYRTGDLVRYTSNGDLEFIDRADQQVKIRGQRVELGEVEHCIKAWLSTKDESISLLAVEIITPHGSERASLAAFVVLAGAAGVITEELKASFYRALDGIDDEIARSLPSYMIPSVYIPLPRMPLTSTGKIDRRQLRKIGASYTYEESSVHTESKSQRHSVNGTAEQLLQQFWAEILNISPDRIYANDSFVRLGGDSIAAMQLAALARQHQMSLSVSDILKWPELGSQALRMLQQQSSRGSMPQRTAPFSLLRNDVDQDRSRMEAAQLCKVDSAQILDILPCTPLQENLLAATSQRSGDYIAQMEFRLAPNIDLNRIQNAWIKTVQRAAILRTRFVDLPGEGLVQVILDMSDDAIRDAISTQKPVRQFEPNTALYNLALIPPNTIMNPKLEKSSLQLVLTIHHALYDGWSLPRLLQAFEEAYKSAIHVELLPLQPFVSHVKNTSSKKATEFWQAQFKDAECAAFPPLPTPNHRPRADSVIERATTVTWTPLDFTASTVIRASWALLQARYTGASDIVFGSVVTGRQAPVSGIEHVSGPTIATVPIRVVMDFSQGETVRELLEYVQLQAINMIEYEQTGIQYIRRIGPQAEHCCQFQTLMIVHPLQENNAPLTILEAQAATSSESVDYSVESFSTYALMINCHLTSSGLTTSFSFDSRVISNIQVERIAAQFEHVLQQVAMPSSANIQLGQIDAVSKQDLQEIWDSNSRTYNSVDECVHEIIGRTVRRQPDATAICAWNGNFTYAELDTVSTRLAHRLLEAGVGRGSIVPLCFEKSKWTTVAVLGVMKAGAASVIFDVTLPEARLRQTAQMVAATVIVASVACKEQARSFNPVVIITPEESWANPTQDAEESPEQALPHVSPSDRLYVAFTSGSTGTPKGAVITHSGFSSTLATQSTALGFHQSARVFDFASHAFDITWSNILHTLHVGGCLCVPSEDERRNDIAGSMRRLRANLTHITPTVARLLDPSDIPGLETLLFCGEAVRMSDVAQWKTLPTVINTYGPTESTVTMTACRITSDLTADPSIGRCMGCNSWITDPLDYTRLMPVGCIGELLMEGPSVCEGYLHNPERTALSFIKDPPWLLKGNGSVPGRRGRVYRTGDLVRYGNDGTLEFIGRQDDQVKIRGQRVELGEIEHHVRRLLNMQAYEGAVEVAAEVVKPSRDGQRSVLVVFISLNKTELGQEALETIFHRIIGGMSDKLAAVLPASMVPSEYFFTSSLPKTPTGKTNRHRLRELGTEKLATRREVTTRAATAVVAPVGAVECALRDIWAQVLNLPAASISTDAFFSQLGGDSISAMQITSRCRSRGIQVKAPSLLLFQTIQRIAAHCATLSEPSSDSIANGFAGEHIDTDGSWPLAPIQKLFLEAHDKDFNHYNQSFMLRIRHVVTSSQILDAVTAVYQKHPMLRARFDRDSDGTWTQRIASSEEAGLVFLEHTTTDISEIQDEAVHRQRALDIQNGPVFAVDVFHGHPDGQAVLLSAHHLVTDLVSWRVIWRELEASFKKVPFAERSMTFRDWCERQAEEARSLSREDVLPFEPEVPNLEYWGMTAEQNLTADGHQFIQRLEPDVTSLLLGSSNKPLSTETADFLVAMLELSFRKTFTDRRSPDLYFEGHGRETINGEDLDVLDTVGWFTTHHPLRFPEKLPPDAIEMLKAAKDLRQQIPNKGRSFFAWTCHSSAEKRYDFPMGSMEILLNYMGRFQQLEGDQSQFALLPSLKSRAQASPGTRRMAMILVTVGVYDGRMELLFDVNKRMRYQERLHDMARTYATLLHNVAVDLAKSDHPED